jgi:hypothetical protein
MWILLELPLEGRIIVPKRKRELLSERLRNKPFWIWNIHE